MLSARQIDTAYHEAGHVAAAIHGRRVPLGVTIVPAGEVAGAVFQRSFGNPDELSTWQRLGWGGVNLRQEAVELLAGAAVDLRLRREWVGWQFDVGRARLALTALYGDQNRAAAELPGVFAEACAVIAKPEVWHAVELIAARLMRRRQLGGMKMVRLALEAAAVIHGADLVRDEMRSWRGYSDLAATAWRDPLAARLTVDDWWLLLWPIGAAAAVLLLHLL